MAYWRDSQGAQKKQIAVKRKQKEPEPDIDCAPWLLTQVVHDLSNAGYTNRLQLEVKLEDLSE